MDNLTKEELEAILYALKLLEQAQVNDRLSIKGVSDEVKQAYIKLVMGNLKK